MGRIIAIMLTGIVTSLYYFPFEFKFLPGVNTKMAMAAFGLVLLGIQLAKGKKASMSKDVFILSIMASVVSLVGCVSITLNSTNDIAYASYIVSMWVWMSAAYVGCMLMRAVHGYLSIRIVCNYIIAVCVVQCVLAMIIDNVPIVKTFIDYVIEQDQDFLNSYKVERLYGIGASLDTAGVRFSVALVMCAYLMTSVHNSKHNVYAQLYVFAFIIISVLGNIISRTTTVGMLLGLMYILYASKIWRLKVSYRSSKAVSSFAVILTICIPVIVILCRTFPNFYDNIKFGFEGFFSLVEKGEWDVSSNEKLLTMYVFPEEIKTWIIGDGYFSSPRNDPYYVGDIVGGYYMGTDVGYLRFIFYFGLIGLVAFSSLLVKATMMNVAKFTTHKELLIAILCVNFVIWFKVATDIFLVFALFLCVTKEEDEDYEAMILIDSNEDNL